MGQFIKQKGLFWFMVLEVRSPRSGGHNLWEPWATSTPGRKWKDKWSQCGRDKKQGSASVYKTHS